MSDAALIEVAKAVVTDLANGPTVDADGVLTSISGQPARLSQSLNVSRMLIPRFNPPDQANGAWQVIVSTDGEQPSRSSRSQVSVEYTVQIGICGKLASVYDQTVLDAAMLLLQQMGDFFFDYGLTGGIATWVRNDVLAWPDRDMLADGGVFFALWNCVFEGSRTRIVTP